MLKKLSLLAALALLLAVPALAQTITTVTGTVQDPNGIPFSYSPVVVTLNGVSGGVSPYVTATGGPVIMPTALTTNPSGTFSTSLVANGSITPSGTTYNIRVCAPAIQAPIGTGAATCVTISAITISGASQDTSATFAAVPPPSLIAQAGVTRVATFAALTQTASLSAVGIYTTPANVPGTYRATCNIVITRAATTSSTLPQCGITYTDQDSSGGEAVLYTATNTANALAVLGTINTTANGPSPGGMMQVAAGTLISVYTSGYVSSGATSMAYAVRVKLEYLGP